MYAQHENDPPRVVAYRADRSAAHLGVTISQGDLFSWNWDSLRWRPSIHMPRWASRIMLEVTGIRVERIQEINSNDIRDEGVFVDVDSHGDV